MSIYLDKLTHEQVVINCLSFFAQFCTGKDTLALILGMPSNEDIMSYDSLTTIAKAQPFGIQHSKVQILNVYEF